MGLNVGGILILPKGFKLAKKSQISAEVKAKSKGVFISPYSTELDNILVVGPIAGKTHQELIFPVVSPDPKTNSNVTIVSSNGTKTSQIVPKGLNLIIKQGDIVKVDQALNSDPNVGGFGQEELEIVLQNP